MRYREITPGPEERRFIDRYWILEDSENGPKPVQRVVPDGCVELILNLGQPFESFTNGQWSVQPECFVAGQITRPLLLRSRGNASILGVRFHPHAAAAVLKIPMHALTGVVVSLNDISLRARRQLEDGRDLDSIRSWIRSMSIPPDALIDTAVRRICGSYGDVDVGNVAAELGVSLRQLQRVFLNHVGLTPKMFARIRRFQKVFQAVEHSPLTWVEAAIDCGYYDQAHLIRDFRELAGETPGSLLAGADLSTHFVRHMPACRIFPRHNF